MDSLEIWNVKLIFRIKTGGGVICKLKNKRNIFIAGKIFQVVSLEVSTCKNENRSNVLSHNNTDGIAI